MENRVYNFNPGPATLPPPVMQQAQAEFCNYRNLGYGILEASHRSPEFEAVINAAEASLRELLGIGPEYAILFLQGGASSQFFMVPMNFLGKGTAEYVDTGEWANKAFKEAKNLGSARVIASSAEAKYTYIPAPATWKCDPQAAYLHITSNNTIFGTQYQEFPTAPAGVPLIADMSSDILSHPFDVNKFGLIYAGAQKNLGPAGVTLVILRQDLLAREPATVPTMLKYSTHVKSKSLFNTPCTFGIYMAKLVLDWLKVQGGLKGMAAINEAKAALLYRTIDGSNGYYRCPVRVDSRSRMNVVWRLPSEELEKRFLGEAVKAGLIGLKGHRSVGGLRASLYNALPLAGVERLVGLMTDFQKRNG